MENPNLKGLIDPAQMRANSVAKEAKERFNKITDKFLKIVIEEKVTTVELPLIIANLTGRVNTKIDGAEIKKILEL